MFCRSCRSSGSSRPSSTWSTSVPPCAVSPAAGAVTGAPAATAPTARTTAAGKRHRTESSGAGPNRNAPDRGAPDCDAPGGAAPARPRLRRGPPVQEEYRHVVGQLAAVEVADLVDRRPQQFLAAQAVGELAADHADHAVLTE